MKTKMYYDQGGAKIPEDKIIFAPPYFFGVLDGVSGVYHPQDGPKLFQGRSGGQMVTQIVTNAFNLAWPEQSAAEIVANANNLIKGICIDEGIETWETDRLPGASYAIAKISKENIDVIHGGDTLAVWLNKNKTIGGTPNQAYDYEKMLRAIVKKLMRKHKGNVADMWREYLPILSEKKRQNMNTDMGKFSELNGQPWFEKYWQRFTLTKEKLSLLIIFSDGLIPFEWTEKVDVLATNVIALYKKGGLPLVHSETRKIFEASKGLTHEDDPEASALAIEF